MDRKDVLNSPEYWTSKTQIELYNQAQKFMETTGKDRAHLAEYLGVSKGYVSQLLNGDYDHRMSKFFELALAFGVIPQIEFIPIEQYIKEDEQHYHFQKVKVDTPKVEKWDSKPAQETIHVTCTLSDFSTQLNIPKKVA